MPSWLSPQCHNGFVGTHALGHMTYSYTLLVPMNQRVLNKLSKKHNISGHKWFTTHRVLKSHRRNMSIIYMLSGKQCVLPVITTMALWQLMHLGITLILLLWDLSTLCCGSLMTTSRRRTHSIWKTSILIWCQNPKIGPKIWWVKKCKPVKMVLENFHIVD